VHGKGLKLGIYSDAGATTCDGRPGSRGHEYQDALTYARWGIDYVKYDWCDAQTLNAEASYTTMRDAIAKSGRPMLFSACEWGINKPWEWGGQVAHSWRTTADIYNCFDCEFSPGFSTGLGVLRILDKQAGLRKFAGPGHWNDMDMLEVGNGMSATEDRAHFSIWVMMASPLIAGNDLRAMSKETTAILTNKAVIAVNQDPLGIQAFRLSAKDRVEFWFKPLAGGDWALMVLNRNAEAQKVTLDWRGQKVVDDLSKRDARLATTRYALRNLWTGVAAGHTDKPLVADLPGHDVLLLRLVPSR
jgi:alpha-galactosidase